MIVRKAERRDAETLFEFILRLDRDGAPVRSPEMSVDDIMAAGFGPDPLFEAFIAETADGVPLGAISFARGYSGWYAKPLAMVHLLFVTEAARGKGIGLKLMAAVADVVVKRNWARLELIVEEDRPAIRFYESIGMQNCEHRHFRLEDRGLTELARKCKFKASCRSDEDRAGLGEPAF